MHRGRRTRTFRAAIAVVTWSVALGWAPAARASATVKQTWLPGECIPQFATPLPTFGPGPRATLPRVDAAANPFLTVTMKEAERQVLPAFTPGPHCPRVKIQPTRIWAYETRSTLTGELLGPAFWPAVTLDVRRGIPTVVKYVNALPAFGAPITIPGVGPTTAKVQGLVSVDPTVHWADPYGRMACMDDPRGTYRLDDGQVVSCAAPYLLSPPAVPHLHGAEVKSDYDGGPEAWFTPDGRKGPAYRSVYPTSGGSAIYFYPNAQEAGTPWFHDHALGATRTNVYSGMAAFYLIRDPLREPRDLPSGDHEVEMAIQDRQFDTESQLLFPDGSGPNALLPDLAPTNPDVHPLWIPEFFGDVAVVNGSPWPYLDVEPRRYRFRIVDGSNARFWNLHFGGVPTWIIGKDDGYLDAPIPVTEALIAPGQRLDLIMDFSRSRGREIVLTNDAPAPYPDGAEPGLDQPSMANVMKFRVTKPLARGGDRSCDPAAGGCRRPPLDRVERLVLHGQGARGGALAPRVKIDKVRQLVLKEHMGEGGPLEVLVNNTKWDAMHSPGICPGGVCPEAFPGGVTELPRVGATELWEIINLTGDAHPMHTHLVQFQVLNRQAFDADELDGYPAAWADAFPGTCRTPSSESDNPCPGYGPPLAYGVNHCAARRFGAEVVGGNPCVDPYLVGPTMPAATQADAAGWNDTAVALPGEVLRLVVRWAPTYAPVALARPGVNLYPFDPTSGPGYVWHCHIVDHEDNEMMRPYAVAR